MVFKPNIAQNIEKKKNDSTSRIYFLTQFFNNINEQLHYNETHPSYYTEVKNIPYIRKIDPKEFLLNPKKQEDFFSLPSLYVNDLLYCIYLISTVENDLIKSKQLEENHPFYQRIISIFNKEANEFNNSHNLQRFYEYTTMMAIDSNMHSHWNNLEHIAPERLSKIVFKSLYENFFSFPPFFEHLGKEKLEQLRFFKNKSDSSNTYNSYELDDFSHSKESDFEQSLPPLDLKHKVLKDIIYQFNTQRSRSKKLLNFINKHLDIPDNWDILIPHLNFEVISYYDLKQIEQPLFNQVMIEYEFPHFKTLDKTQQLKRDIDEAKNTTIKQDLAQKYTVENVAKYNSMNKALTNCIHGREAYDLDGKLYNFKKIEELIRSFFEDSFLKTMIIPVMKDKSHKSKKDENKTLWLYHAMTLESELNNLNKEVATTKNKNKL